MGWKPAYGLRHLLHRTSPRDLLLDGCLLLHFKWLRGTESCPRETRAIDFTWTLSTYSPQPEKCHFWLIPPDDVNIPQGRTEEAWEAMGTVRHVYASRIIGSEQEWPNGSCGDHSICLCNTQEAEENHHKFEHTLTTGNFSSLTINS